MKYYKHRISLTRLNMDGFISCAICRTTGKFLYCEESTERARVII